MAKKTTKGEKTVETIEHPDSKRRNIPTAEMQPVMAPRDEKPVEVRYPRNVDLDPQLVWRGKDAQDAGDLVVNAPPLYIQEKVGPKALIDDLLKQTKREREAADKAAGRLQQMDLFARFNGLPKNADKTDFYRYDQNWTNRMILGDSLQVMASLAEREGMRGKVQCIYFDPPYGIKFNSNFQWSTTSRDVKDGNAGHITREPEQVKAFRDTWRDGIHSYLTYLRDRLMIARDLLSDSGSIFVQIGDENAHRVRALLDEVFGASNCVGVIAARTTSGAGSFSGGTKVLASVTSYLVWYARNLDQVKYRQLYNEKSISGGGGELYSLVRSASGLERRATPDELANTSLLEAGARLFRPDNLVSQTTRVGQTTVFPIAVSGREFSPRTGGWKTNREGMRRLLSAERVRATAGLSVQYVRFLDDFPAMPLSNVWTDVGTGSFTEEKVYVVQTNLKIVQRCILMATDPGDLVLDPTCGSGTTATVAEQWGRRWITIDTSRVALALARARIMGARYPYYLLADSKDGQQKEAEVSQKPVSTQPTHDNIRHGFVYERVPHITLKSIANNAEIDVIWDKWQQTLEPLREKLNKATKNTFEEWQIPREADPKWTDASKRLHADWWQARIARQKEIDASIAAKAEFEYLYDRPYEHKKKVRVAGPFTVESLSPHRMLAVGDDDELIDPLRQKPEPSGATTFAQMVLDNLRTAGVQQEKKEDRITFTSLVPWPGTLICGEGKYVTGQEPGSEMRAAIFIGPEFGTVQRADLVEAAREAADGGFDVLIACAFNYEAHTTEFGRLGKLPVLKARMNADLHMAADLKNTGKGNLFVVFGEPDIELLKDDDGKLRVKVNGVDVFKPQTGEVVSHGADGIACWFVDTDYDQESFFVRHAYFLGQNDPYSALKTTLKAEIDPDAWATLHSDTSRPFEKPRTGRIAVKVINHLGDEVMKVFKV
jgi:adenine-specific DNA-methyltransferase